MERKAFKMHVNPSAQAEYERRHNPIWSDLEQVLKEHGAHHYSIFLDAETSTLFGYVEIESQERWDAVAATPECQRWYAHMKDVMLSNPDNSPVSSVLRQVFYLD